MRYLKTFGNHNNYEDFTETEAFVRPNVSYCVQENEVHYNPIAIITVRYNVMEVEAGPIPTTQLYTYTTEDGITVNGAAMFDKAVIDGVEVSIADLDTAEGTYQFSTVGEHTVKYTLKDPTIIGVFGSPSDPSSVKIGAMFYGCETITAVEMPNSVTSIGISAFNGCSSLTSVTIGSSVTSIGNYTFQNCYSLTSVEIPKSVTSIGISAFNGCRRLTSVTIPNGVTSIGEGAFYDCTGLASVIIPNSITNIDHAAFQNCSSLTSVTIPNSVTSIGVGAFLGCRRLTNVTIPNGVTSIGGNAFNGCSGLTSITSLAPTAPTITNSTFQNVKTNGTLTVPSGSSGYDVWMGTGNYYLGSYNWTKVEQ